MSPPSPVDMTPMIGQPPTVGLGQAASAPWTAPPPPPSQREIHTPLRSCAASPIKRAQGVTGTGGRRGRRGSGPVAEGHDSGRPPRVVLTTGRCPSTGVSRRRPEDPRRPRGRAWPGGPPTLIQRSPRRSESRGSRSVSWPCGPPGRFIYLYFLYLMEVCSLSLPEFCTLLIIIINKYLLQFFFYHYYYYFLYLFYIGSRGGALWLLRRPPLTPQCGGNPAHPPWRENLSRTAFSVLFLRSTN